MSKNFKFGAKKNRKRKSRMKIFNPNKKTTYPNRSNANLSTLSGSNNEEDISARHGGQRVTEQAQFIFVPGGDYDEGSLNASEHNQIISYTEVDKLGCNANVDQEDHDRHIVNSNASDGHDNEERTASTEQFTFGGERTPEHDLIISYSNSGHGADYGHDNDIDQLNSNCDELENFQVISFSDVDSSHDDYEQNADKEIENSDDFMEIEHDAIDQHEEDDSHYNSDPHATAESENVGADDDDGFDESNAIEDDADCFEDFGRHGDAFAATRIVGRRIVELDRFIEQLADIADHNYGECLARDLVVTKEIKNGFQSKCIFQCTTCSKKFSILTNEDVKTTETVCVNSTAVLASNMIGIGFSQLEQFTSVLDIPAMCADRFKSLNDDVGALWEITAEKAMKDAAEEERQAAIARGDVDEEDGIPFISVVTDGCWCKRSYHKNYNALSGVAAIVGATFGKVLWIGVRNKYCVVCVRHKNKNTTPPDHFCTRNYTGPSSDMEWQSILQGFEKSVEMHNMRYTKVIADGDSSTYLKLLDAKPYQHRIIEKDECCNHLLRNFRKQLESSATGCPRGLTKHVESSLERIRKGISCAVKYRNDEEIDGNDKIALLKSDISNVIHHVFGDHTNCPDYIKEFCREEENLIPALMNSGTYEKLSTPIRKLMYCAKDLLLAENNNIAEHYNSIVAKFVGGKRVNFALSNSYLYKANAAAVQFNTKKAVTTLYQTVFQRDPSALTQKIESKRLQKAIRERNRRTVNKANHIRPKRFNDTKEKGSGYGEHCEAPDLSEANFENEKKFFLDKLKQNHDNRIAIELQTRMKEQSALFQRITSTVLMASNFGSVCKSRVMAKQVKDICKQTASYNKAARHNHESQPVAKKQLEKEQQISIRDCGVFMDKNDMCLAASPSGITIDDVVIEIQCPKTVASKDPNKDDVLQKLPFMEKSDKGKWSLKKSHDIFYQIQGDLHVLEKNVCLFAIWTSSQFKMYVERIDRDEQFFVSKMKSRLTTFYHDWLLPELVNPRLSRNMPVREPGTQTVEQSDK